MVRCIEASVPPENLETVLVRKLAKQCSCPVQFPVKKLAEGKYQVGHSRTVICVRVLSDRVMVRVGGGWIALQAYLAKHDPCRMKGRRGNPKARKGPPRQNPSSSTTTPTSSPTDGFVSSLASRLRELITGLFKLIGCLRFIFKGHMVTRRDVVVYGSVSKAKASFKIATFGFFCEHQMAVVTCVNITEVQRP